MRRARLVPLLHVAYWALYLVLLAFLFAIVRAQSHASLLPRLLSPRPLLLFLAPNIVAFYLAYFVLFARLLARGRLAAFLAAVVVAALAIAAGCLGLLGATSATPLPTFTSAAAFAASAGLLAGLAAVHMGIAAVLRGFVAWVDDLAVKEELARQHREVEAALVRSKLDPHFLFNTLNNLDVLVARDPAAASRYLQELSEILRFVLYEAAAERIALDAELGYVAKYVALQRLRSADPDFAALDVSGDPRGIRIAPMLLIPFIENAFKHAAGQRAAGSIRIGVAVDGGRVTFRCSNRYTPGAAGERPSGLGNQLMRRRLLLLYPERHTLEIADRDGRFAVTLTLETDDRPLPHP